MDRFNLPQYKIYIFLIDIEQLFHLYLLKEKDIKESLGVKRRNRVLWPTLFSNNTLGEGNNLKRVIKGKVGFQNAPVTQCYYPKVDSTITHHKKLGSVYQTGTFRQMEVLESLYERTTETSSS